MSRAADIAGMIVVLAIIATLVSHRQTAQVVKAGGSVFTDSIKAAKG
jgi:deoxyhypusine synthase